MTLFAIQQHLERAAAPGSLRDLFCTVLNWGALSDPPQRLPACAPDGSGDLTAHPLAHLGGVPVFRVDWPAAKMPTVTERRKVQHTLAPIALEHIMCYVAQEGRRVALVWAR